MSSTTTAPHTFAANDFGTETMRSFLQGPAAAAASQIVEQVGYLNFFGGGDDDVDRVRSPRYAIDALYPAGADLIDRLRTHEGKLGDEANEVLLRLTWVAYLVGLAVGQRTGGGR